MDGRIAHIQVAKGMAIILVAFNHSDLAAMLPTVNDALRTFRVPLFFFLAGVFFSIRESWWPFLLRKADALLKPYVVTALLYLALCYWRGPVNVAWQLKAIGYGSGYWLALAPLWFLPHLLALYVVAYVGCRWGQWWQRPLWLRWLVVVVLLVVGTVTLDRWWLVEIEVWGWRKVVPGLPWSADLLPLSGGFFLCGNLLCGRVKALPLRPLLTLGLALLFVAVTGWSGVRVDLNQRVLQAPLLAVGCAFVGILLALQLSLLIQQRLPLLSRVLQSAGDASLFVLVFHAPINRLGLSWAAAPTSITALLGAFLASVLAPILLRQLVAHLPLLRLLYLPVVGKRPLPETASAAARVATP